MNEDQQVRRYFGGREIDPVEAASIHIALEELRDRANSYLEVEIAEDDSAQRIEANCRAVASELGLRLRFIVTGTRHVRDARGRIHSEPSVLQVRVAQEHEC
ncbi:MAG TPA: hypothetical protein VHB98_15305 [Chloroflexota bacterium]|jgi:hypothetical protein|nr:hypothetical protein [Chloroflexota bacterium]